MVGELSPSCEGPAGPGIILRLRGEPSVVLEPKDFTLCVSSSHPHLLVGEGDLLVLRAHGWVAAAASCQVGVLN